MAVTQQVKTRAFRVEAEGLGQGRLVEFETRALKPSEVLIKVLYSSVNYKDALAGTGRGKILKSFPLVPGIDLAGIVAATASPHFSTGDQVILTGSGTGEERDGGYSEYQIAPADALVRCPPSLSLRDAMVLGTAGFTAALAIHRMEQLGQTPQKGPIVVTGASGGVGNFAVNLLAARGYEVLAVSGKAGLGDFLQKLGAAEVLRPEELALGSRPLEKARFGGAIDNVGGEVLAGLVAATHLWGNVAAIGLTGGVTFNTTVMPFILRGVSVIGVSSNNCPMDLRSEIWQKLASIWRPRNLEQILARVVGLDELGAVFEEMLERKTHGRVLVTCSPEQT